MKHSFSKKTLHALLLSAGLLLAPASYAATLDDVVNSVNGVIIGLNKMSQMFIELIFQETPNITETIQLNDTVAKANKSTIVSSTKSTLKSITNTLDIATSDDSDEQTKLTTLYASGSLGEPETRTFGLPTRSKPLSKLEGDLNFSIDSLLGPTAYPNKEALENAQNYVRFAADLVKPLTTLDLSSLTDKEKEDDLSVRASYQQYLLSLRSSVAARSAGLNNLYAMEAERTLSPGLGAEANIRNSKGQPVNDISPLQLKQYMATRRATNPEWFAAMEAAPPATIERESLFLLAEMRQEMFENRMMMERLLALMSLQHIQNVNANARIDLAAKQQAVEKDIDNIKAEAAKKE